MEFVSGKRCDFTRKHPYFLSEDEEKAIEAELREYFTTENSELKFDFELKFEFNNPTCDLKICTTIKNMNEKNKDTMIKFFNKILYNKILEYGFFCYRINNSIKDFIREASFNRGRTYLYHEHYYHINFATYEYLLKLHEELSNELKGKNEIESKTLNFKKYVEKMMEVNYWNRGGYVLK